jgi:hypothetical protein
MNLVSLPLKNNAGIYEKRKKTIKITVNIIAARYSLYTAKIIIIIIRIQNQCLQIVLAITIYCFGMSIIK